MTKVRKDFLKLKELNSSRIYTEVNTRDKKKNYSRKRSPDKRRRGQEEREKDRER